MASLAAEEIRNFLFKLGQRFPHPAQIFLLGGGALCLLGNPRRTLDIDYALYDYDEHFNQLRAVIDTIAQEEKLELEAIPIQDFIPLPPEPETRHIKIDQIGQLEIFVFDPYSIALSKIGRGFEADLQDVLYLLDVGVINLGDLSIYIEQAKVKAWEYDINPEDLQLRFNEIQRLRD